MLFLLVSIVLMFLWLRRYLNSNKLWYFQTSSSAVAFGAARFWYYVFPFFTLTCVFFGIKELLRIDPYDPAYKIASRWMDAGVVSIVIGFVCGFLQPSWLSPSWLRKLRQEYGKGVINLLIDDAIGMEKDELAQRLETWEDIEAWITEVQNTSRF
jgi:hypothetical protein